MVRIPYASKSGENLRNNDVYVVELVRPFISILGLRSRYCIVRYIMVIGHRYCCVEKVRSERLGVL